MKHVANSLNLYIDITTACNAACGFCIAPTIGRANGPKFLDGLVYALGFTRMHDGSVQIIGGEPMISAHVGDVFAQLALDSYPNVVLNTNGSFVSHRKVVAAATAGVRWFNISRHHYDAATNQGIMKIAPPVSNTTLRGAVRRIQNEKISVRLNCNLISGHIDSADKMADYITWAETVGVSVVSFSQVFPLSLFDYQIAPSPGYTESVQVDLAGIVRELDANYSSVPAAQLREMLGPYTSQWQGGGTWGGSSSLDNPLGKRRYWLSGDSAFSLKVLSGYNPDTGIPNETTYRKEEDPELTPDTIHFIVLHPDGVVTASWDKRERILFNPYKKVSVSSTVYTAFPSVA